MLFLILAILSSTMVSVIMRLSTGRISANLSMLAVNYLICSLLGALYAGFELFVPQEGGFFLTVGLGGLSGAFYLAGFVMLQQSIRKNGVVLSSVFMKLGLLVPIILSLVFFKEIPTAAQIGGFFIAIGAIILINLKKDADTARFSGGLIVLLLLGGCCDSMSKVFEFFGPAELSEQFLFYTFAAAFVLCAMMVIQKKERPGIREWVFGALIGLPNFFSAKFLLLALAKLPAVVVYPSFSVATLLLITLTGVAVFREKLEKLQWIALGAIVVALALLNM